MISLLQGGGEPSLYGTPYLYKYTIFINVTFPGNYDYENE